MTFPRTHRGRALTASALALTLMASAACTSSGSPKKAGTPGSSAASAAPASSGASSGSKAAPRRAAAVNPLTGIGPAPKTPLIAVKIDDTAPGRPQVGIDKADIVYIEAVEAGYTRLAALFGTSKPLVGYVRSTRPSDPELLIQYGRITEAFSGGQQVSRDLAARAGLRTWNFGGGKPYYARVQRSESTYINLRLNLSGVAKSVHTTAPRSNGWTFARTLPVPSARGTRVRTVVTGVYSVGTGTPVEFRYNGKLKKYVRYINGVAQHAADGHLIAATNVVVQSCQVHAFTADRDVNGYPAQFTTSVGRGKVVVFRQGRRVTGTWSRPHLASGTTLRTTQGKGLPLAPGNTWVVLIRNGIAVTG